MLECTYHLRSAHPFWKRPEDTISTITVRNKSARRAPVSLESSVVALSLGQKLQGEL